MFTTIMQVTTIIAVVTLISLALFVAYKLRTTPDDADSPDVLVRKNVEAWSKKRQNDFCYRPSVTLHNLHLSLGNTKMYKLHTEDKRLVGSLSEAFLRNEFAITPQDIKSYVIEVKLINIPNNEND